MSEVRREHFGTLVGAPTGKAYRICWDLDAKSPEVFHRNAADPLGGFKGKRPCLAGGENHRSTASTKLVALKQLVSRAANLY